MDKELIIQAKQKLGKEAINIIINDLQIEEWDGTKGKSPFKIENTPSFTWFENQNCFKCFATGKIYDIINHYMEFNNLSHVKAVEKLFGETNTVYNFIETKKDLPNYTYPKRETNKNRVEVEKYCAIRGISAKTLDFAEVKQSQSGNNLVFEHKDVDGRLLCIKYKLARKATKKDKQKSWWQQDASTCPILWGIEKIDPSKPLLITEGHMDRLACIEANFTNTVSIPHGANDISFISFNWDFLEQFDSIIIYGDNDIAGNKFLKESVLRLGEHRIKIVTPNSDHKEAVRKYFKTFSKNSNITKCDANNILLACGKEELYNLIMRAEEVPVKDIIKIMSCEEFDITKSNVITYGLNILDNKLYGNVAGTLSLYSGTTGSGKSLFTTLTCINEPINQGLPVFMYSGELPNAQVKNWVMRQLAGRNHIIKWDNGANKPSSYSVTNDARKKIETKYMELLHAYDAYLIVTARQLLNKMEYMAKRYGVRDFIIDNMMCVALEDENEIRAQTNFTMEMLNFARKYNARVNLVIHPKKMQFGVEVGLYDLYGSSSTVNLAQRVFVVRRVTQKEKAGSEKVSPVRYDTFVSCLKDRILGVPETKFGLFYDPPSQRLFSDKDGVDKVYSWDDNSIKYNTANFGSNGVLSGELEKEVFG